MSNSTFTAIHKLLFHWKGSIWKSIWKELLLWLILYLILSMIYRYALPPGSRELGFYVTSVFTRWTAYLNQISLVDTPALFIATNIRGADTMTAIVYFYISKRVKRRFPNTDKMVEAGLMTQQESDMFKNLESTHAKFWLPSHWLFNLLRKAKDLELFGSDFIYMTVMEKVSTFRANTMKLVIYDYMPIPLIYTQVVNLTVRCYFLFNLLGRQFIRNDHGLNVPIIKMIDLYVPVITIFQIIFYLGWMKAAEVMLNPLGEDDDDLELNYILDRNLDCGYLMVDDCYDSLPCEPFLGGDENRQKNNGINSTGVMGKTREKETESKRTHEIKINMDELDDV